MSIDNVNYLTGVAPGRHAAAAHGVDYLDCYVCAEGRRLGVLTPANDAVVAEVSRRGVGILTPDPKNVEPLLAILPIDARTRRAERQDRRSIASA